VLVSLSVKKMSTLLSVAVVSTKRMPVVAW